MSLYFRIIKYIRPYLFIVVLGILFSMLMSLFNVLMIPMVAEISKAIANNDLHNMNLFIALAICIFLAKSIFSFLQKYIIAHANQGVTRDLRIKIFEHLQNLSLDFFSKTNVGNIIVIVMNDINRMQAAIFTSFTSVAPNFFTLIAISAYLLKLNWRLSLVSFTLLPIITFISTKFGRRIKSIGELTQVKRAEITSALHENLTGAKIVKTFTMEDQELKRFSNASDELKQYAIKTSLLNAVQTPLISFIQTFAAVAVIWLGGFELMAGRISTPNLIAFFSGVLMLSGPVGGMSGFYMTIQVGLVSAARFFGLLDTQPTVKDKYGASEVSSLKGEVNFKDINFKYDENQNFILKDINLTCRSGEIVALVGKSGAGKSTLVSLIPRLYDVSSGSLTIDGQDIKEYKIRSLRKFIGIVPQETLLFSGTIRDNISYGKTDATQNEVEDAAKLANAHDFILTFPDKYDTLIGEKGVRLSGGERQRISIARAILRNPRILILDEATSSLDSHSEKKVQQALEKLMSGRTTFVIAHRLSTVRFADKIIVIDNGIIAESGKHEELIIKKGLYENLYNLQMGSFEETLPDVFGVVEIDSFRRKIGSKNTISGWVIADDNSKIDRIELVHSNNIVGKSTLEIVRADVQIKYPNFTHSLYCGFKIDFELNDIKSGPILLKVFDQKGRKLKVKHLKVWELTRRSSLDI